MTVFVTGTGTAVGKTWVLVRVLRALRRDGVEVGVRKPAQSYAPAELGRTISVDLLNRSLLNDFLPVQALRGLGLHLLANVGPLRRLVMRSGMDAPGRLPRLMQPGGQPGGADSLA